MLWELGLVVHDDQGWPWVYIGHRVTSVKSINRTFAKAEMGEKLAAPPWTYNASRWETLCRKFPDLINHAPPATELWG